MPPLAPINFLDLNGHETLPGSRKDSFSNVEKHVNIGCQLVDAICNFRDSEIKKFLEAEAQQFNQITISCNSDHSGGNIFKSQTDRIECRANANANCNKQREEQQDWFERELERINDNYNYVEPLYPINKMCGN